MWKKLLQVRKSDRRAMLLLSTVIICGLATSYFISKIPIEITDATDEDRQLINDFIASVRSSDSDYEKKNTYRKDSYQQTAVVLASFDPNTADSITFVRLGLKPYIARNILKYRAKGGKFRTTEAFAKVYGITAEQYRQLQPYIHIGKDYQPPTNAVQYAEAPKLKDSIRVSNFAKQEKYAEGTTIELNAADTAELKKIPQIGSGLARMIVSYREKLGGFHSTAQLKEIEHIPDGIERWFTMKKPNLRTIQVNKASVELLRKHPYLNFYQAKVIVDHRKKYGKIKSLSELSLYSEFTQKDFERISPYLRFE